MSTNLDLLPLELLHAIRELLGPVDRVCLRQAIPALLHDGILMPADAELDQQHRFEYLTRLQTQTKYSNQDMQPCTGCLQFHSTASFPDDAPQCQSSRKLWICPHRALPFVAAQAMLGGYDMTSVRDLACPECRNNFISARISCKNGFDDIKIVSGISLFLTLNPVSRPAEEAIANHYSADRMRLLLKALDLPLCNHVRTSSTVFLETWNTSRREIIRSSNEGDGSCKFCSAMWYFVITSNRLRRSNQRYTNQSLVVFRNLGRLNNPYDPSWQAHLLTDAEMDQLCRRWEQWTTFRAHMCDLWTLVPVRLQLVMQQSFTSSLKKMIMWPAKKLKALGTRFK